MLVPVLVLLAVVVGDGWVSMSVLVVVVLGSLLLL